MIEPLMDPSALGDYLGIPVNTIYAWRHQGAGPPAMKVGKHLRYRKSDVDAWLLKQQNVA